MPLPEAVRILHDARTSQVVLTSMASAREWMKLPADPLDLVHVPSSMGQTQSIALGLALARPDRQVIACCGDGSLLMNLGSLVTITSCQPNNLVLVLFDNGVYEITGGQTTPASAPRPPAEHGTEPDFVALARASGFATVFQFATAGELEGQIADVLQQPGPVFVHLLVEPVAAPEIMKSPGPAPPRAAALRAALLATAE